MRQTGVCPGRSAPVGHRWVLSGPGDRSGWPHPASWRWRRRQTVGCQRSTYCRSARQPRLWDTCTGFRPHPQASQEQQLRQSQSVSSRRSSAPTVCQMRIQHPSGPLEGAPAGLTPCCAVAAAAAAPMAETETTAAAVLRAISDADSALPCPATAEAPPLPPLRCLPHEGGLCPGGGARLDRALPARFAARADVGLRAKMCTAKLKGGAAAQCATPPLAGWLHVRGSQEAQPARPHLRGGAGWGSGIDSALPWTAACRGASAAAPHACVDDAASRPAAPAATDTAWAKAALRPPPRGAGVAGCGSAPRSCLPL